MVKKKEKFVYAKHIFGMGTRAPRLWIWHPVLLTSQKSVENSGLFCFFPCIIADGKKRESSLKLSLISMER